MPAALIDLSGVKLDETVTRYLETRKPSTALAYEKCLRRFVLFYGRPFRDFLIHLDEERKANLDRAVHDKVRPGENIVRDFIRWHEEVGYANYSTLQSLGAVQNILKFYGIPISYEFVETPSARPMKVNDKHEWTLDQVREFVRSAEYIRDKAFIVFAFQSGLSISDIMILDYGDIKREFEEGVLPMAIEKFREKTNTRIRTFIGADGVRYLKLYLESRPNIKPKDPIFTLLGTEERATPASIQKKLRNYAEKLNFLYEEDMEGYNPARPHSLRSGFRSRLTGKMDGDLIESFMGHELGQEKSTYINMPLDELRELYSNYEYLLTIERTSRDELAEREPVIPEEALERIQKLEFENEGLKRKYDKLLDDTVREKLEFREWQNKIEKQLRELREEKG